LGGIGPMVLVYKVSRFVYIVDIRTMQTYELDEKYYWKYEFKALLSRDRLSEFVVINIENVDNDNNSSRAAVRQGFRQVQVEIARKEDFGVNDKTFIVNTHLGEILNFNDTVLGYDLLKN
jgi:nonsense-mediated mRNA decay protein 3